MASNAPIIRARYAVKGPKREVVHFRKYYMDENKSLQYTDEQEERDCYMIFFPHGHSIRVTSYERLKELGYHLKPRMVDMRTGDVIDLGGDPYDFANGDGSMAFDPALIDEDEGLTQTVPKRKAAN